MYGVVEELIQASEESAILRVGGRFTLFTRCRDRESFRKIAIL